MRYIGRSRGIAVAVRGEVVFLDDVPWTIDEAEELVALFDYVSGSRPRPAEQNPNDPDDLDDVVRLALVALRVDPHMLEDMIEAGRRLAEKRARKVAQAA